MSWYHRLWLVGLGTLAGIWLLLLAFLLLGVPPPQHWGRVLPVPCVTATPPTPVPPGALLRVVYQVPTPPN